MSSLALGSDGEYYNVNADQMASACAIACKADTLIWDQPGCVTQDPKFPEDVPNDGQCYAAPGGASLQVKTQVTNNPGCQPDPAGGQPTGSITSAGNVVTVCCQN